MEDIQQKNLKQEIEAYFIQHGFKKDNDNLLFEQEINQQMVVNGAVYNNPIKRVVELQYLGEGEVDNEFAVGYKWVDNKQEVLDVWLTSVDDVDLFGQQFRK